MMKLNFMGLWRLMIVDDDLWSIVVIHGMYLPVMKHGLLENMPFSTMTSFQAINLYFLRWFPFARPVLITGGQPFFKYRLNKWL